MFAYALIAIELVILYMAFWYVFIREPKPYKVSGQMWGTYPRAAQTPIPNGMECCGVASKATAPSFEAMVASQRGAQRRHGRQSASARKQMGMKYGWVAAEDQVDEEGVSKVISIFRNAFDAIAVKLP